LPERNRKPSERSEARQAEAEVLFLQQEPSKTVMISLFLKRKIPFHAEPAHIIVLQHTKKLGNKIVIEIILELPPHII
jgi:hypothetical protein